MKILHDTIRLADIVIPICIVLLYSSCREEVFPQESAVPPPQVKPERPCRTNLAYGYCDKTSYWPGESITAYLHASQATPLCQLNVYAMNGAIAFSVPSPLFVQSVNASTPASNGFGFFPTIEIPIPAETKSGVYLIEGKIPFIIKSDSESDILVVYPSNTANAYAATGGKSLYTAPADARPSTVSFHRPIDLQPFTLVCLQWFTSQPDLKIAYLSDGDLDDYENIQQSKILTIIGHNEYWTRKARNNFDRFVDRGGHALILSGNTMWWQVRYSDNGTRLVCYKDVTKDPVGDPLHKTIEWSRPSLEYSILSSIGADYDHGGYGLRSDKGWNGLKVVNPSSPLLEGLALKKGDIIQCPTAEYDGAPIASFDPEGFPVLDKAILDVEKAEIIAFDKGFRVVETYGTFMVLKKTKRSGVIVNTGTTDWCSSNGMGGQSGDIIKKITRNAIEKLLNKQNVFSD
jgi:hypothetical protein